MTGDQAVPVPPGDCLNDRAIEAAAAAIGEYPSRENLVTARLMLEAALPHIAVNFMSYQVGKAAGLAQGAATERDKVRTLVHPGLLRRLAAQCALDGAKGASDNLYVLADLLDGTP